MCVQSEDPRAKSQHPEHRLWWLERRHTEMVVRMDEMNQTMWAALKAQYEAERELARMKRILPGKDVP